MKAIQAKTQQRRIRRAEHRRIDVRRRRKDYLRKKPGLRLKNSFEKQMGFRPMPRLNLGMMAAMMHLMHIRVKEKTEQKTTPKEG